MSKKTIKHCVLEILSDYKPHHAKEFLSITHRFSATIERLRHQEGYNIVTLYREGRNRPAWYQLIKD
ncbi:MAG: hypothetical protein ACKPH7_32945 [Planktothrix sp.]|uniref:hypothetical protein n=1 Tax=Planktothrix sp. TaxID=3088171 RepID=UPI0038D4E21C